MTFRAGLLDGCRVAFAGQRGSALLDAQTALGAWADTAPTSDDEELMAAWVTQRLPLDALVHDTRPAFAAGGAQALQATLAQAWITARSVATQALIPSDTGGRLMFLAPASDAGPHADAARAALENLARTVSVEWARFAVTAVTIWPGTLTTEDELGELLAFLLSGAGAYFSGCRFELGAAADARRFISAS